MTDDLAARLRATRDAYEARETDARPDDAELAALYRDVRRHRMLRSVRSVGVAAATVAAVASVGWYGLNVAPDVHPAGTPTPTGTATPTPGPTATPSTTPSATPVRTPVEHAGMPTTWALDETVLASVGPGWTLATYVPSTPHLSTPYRVVLSSPDGELYDVSELPEDVVVTFLAWGGGTTAAVATSEGRATYDLRTGELTPDPRGLPADARVHDARGGAELWLTSDGSPWVVPATGPARPVPGGTWEVTGLAGLSPDATRAVAGSVVVDLGTGRTTSVAPAGLDCTTLGWADAATVALLCTDPVEVDPGDFQPYLLRDPASRPRYVLAAADGSSGPQVRELRTGDLVPSRVRALRSGALAVAGSPLASDPISCATTTELRRSDTVEQLVGDRSTDLRWATVTDVFGDVVHVRLDAACEGSGPVELAVVDTVTGTTTLLPRGEGNDQMMVPGSAVTRTG